MDKYILKSHVDGEILQNFIFRIVYDFCICDKRKMVQCFQVLQKIYLAVRFSKNWHGIGNKVSESGFIQNYLFSFLLYS